MHRINIPPPVLLAILYAGLIIAGGIVLKLPISNHVTLSWSDAIFTATSAVTVTGLVVADTGGDFTWVGQAVILLLIQLGGLGLMTFAALVFRTMGLPIGLQHRQYLKEDLNQTSVRDLLRLVRIIFRVVVLFELAGTALLSIVFVPEFGILSGLWISFFHAVSAFNNAGFSLFSDSLSRWVTNPLINLVIPLLFILGGIGFTVLADIYQNRSWNRYSLHTKLMLAGSLGLIVWSVLTFTALEWSNPSTLGRFDLVQHKLTASWFQAVTTRTAGFNTLDISAIHDSTALMLISLMLIGAGSTSTAGGIKVTTFLVLLLAAVAFFRRRSSIHAFGRSLGTEEIMKVLALTVISMLLIMFGTFVITISHDGDFLDLVFEVASAFGTVGLSRGTTGNLDILGRIVVCVLMFIGRVGPLTLGVYLMTRAPSRIKYPSSEVHLG